MIRTILVPLDGSPLAERALPYAGELARRGGARVLLMRAADSVGHLLQAVRDAQAYLGETVTSVAGGGASVESNVVHDSPADAIIDEAALRRADLIVMATHARSAVGRLIHGSVADAVARRAGAPVLLVPPAAAAWPEPATAGTSRPHRIVVPLDGSPLAETALGPALDLSEVLAAEVVLLQAVEPPRLADYDEAPVVNLHDPQRAAAAAHDYLNGVACECRCLNRPITTHVVHGEPAATISRAARDLGATLIVMATHGRGGLVRATLGSVATSVVEQTTVPTLLVRERHALTWLPVRADCATTVPAG